MSKEEITSKKEYRDHTVFIMLFDFLKDLPEDFDRDKTSYAECEKIIKNFMVKHGLFEIATDLQRHK